MKIRMLFILASFVIGLGSSGTTAWAVQATAEPNPLYQGALAWELPDDAEPMVVHSVTDGDTVRLTEPGDDWYYNTRIIGISAPELDGPWTDEGCYGPEAKAFLAELLPVGTKVMVQQDISDEDRNGRRLRHIFLIDDQTDDAYLVSEVLVLGGYAEARSYPPDDLYDDVLADAELLAQQQDDGLWDACAA
jgi:endonuclease YncB( thermonuclease family)